MQVSFTSGQIMDGKNSVLYYVDVHSIESICLYLLCMAVGCLNTCMHKCIVILRLIILNLSAIDKVCGLVCILQMLMSVMSLLFGSNVRRKISCRYTCTVYIDRLNLSGTKSQILLP